MFDFYNSLFRVLFNFGCNYPQQIVAKTVGKVKVFHRKTEEKSREGQGYFPMEIQPHRRQESVRDFACVMTQAVLAILDQLKVFNFPDFKIIPINNILQCNGFHFFIYYILNFMIEVPNSELNVDTDSTIEMSLLFRTLTAIILL